MNPMIEFQNYSFKYRAQKEPTLKNINLKIYPGQKVLIVGPSGCGKSTLAHCLNGLVPFAYGGESDGSLRVNGCDPASEGIFGMSKIIGTVLQDTDGQFIGLTVAEDIAFALENDCVAQKEMFERVDAVANKLELKKLLSNAPTELSGGQKQRVSMAGVMIDDVDILLFDEPLANLDPATGKRTIELIDRIKKESDTTVIIIEHRLEDVLYKDVDRIIVMHEGEIVSDTTPDELLCTDILVNQGIREPLYLTALKYADVALSPDMHPMHMQTMQLMGQEEKVRNWYHAVQMNERMKSQDIVLEVKHLDFSYLDNKPILKNISFGVHRGEMLSIVGKNGAGKSTLSSVICGFLSPDHGEILLNGQDISPLSIKERGEKIGFVMQNPNQMISDPMIFDEVALGLRAKIIPEEEIKERVNDTLKVCGLYPFRNWPVSALSYGQKKRVTIASILVMNPEILILDEPTAGQDYKHYTEIMEFIKKLNKEQNVTIIMITHDMHLMLEYTDRAIVLADGELLVDDKPSVVLTQSEIADKAYLKTTSLYDLALACDIEDVSGFTDCFIAYDREVREHGQNT